MFISKDRPSPWVLQLGLPALAGSIAVLFSHPLELTKIRLQLDNELAQRGTARKYTGWLDCVAQSWRSQGVRGLQRGLTLGVTREFFFNGLRIGCFEPLVGVLHTWSGRQGPPGGDTKMAAGLIAGALGGCFINPIDVCKTRAQALGGATGHQHAAARGPVEALRSLLADEGTRGLVRGVGTNTLRGLLGPGSQLVAYTDFKERMGRAGFDASAVATHGCCSLASAAVSVSVVNPVDVVRTRLFNQPFDATSGRGLWYKNGFDAAVKVTQVEGLSAVYKGAGANFLRLGPHMMLVFVTLEQLKQRFSARG